MLLAVQFVILGFCASNTPARTARFVARFPSLSFLLREEPMYEFTIEACRPRDRHLLFAAFASRVSRKTTSTGPDDWARILQRMER